MIASLVLLAHLQITLIVANNTAAINRNNAQQTEEIIQTQWQNRALAYLSVKEDLGLSEASFLQYLETELMRLSGKVVVN